MLADLPERPKIPPETPLSVVLVARPGANDAQAVAQAVAQDWLTWLGQTVGGGEVLLIVDPDEAVAEAPHDPRLRIVHQVAPRGLGPSLQTAIWLARHPLLLTAPADRQFLIGDAKFLFDHIDQVDLVTGWRVAGPPPWWLRGLGFLHRLATLILLGYTGERRAAWHGWRGLWRRFRVRHIFGVQVHDAECDFRLYRTEVLRPIPIQSAGSFAHVEILAKANHLGCLMTEAPVPWTPPPNPEPDSSWAADYKLLKRRPDFGPPFPAGIAARDLLASDHEAKSGNLAAPSKLGG